MNESGRIGGTAVVIGASMGGLCAARVLSEYFGTVIVFDRDSLPAAAVPRARVPQGQHPHLLLRAGAQLLEKWFPGLDDELMAGGAIDLDLCRDFAWYQRGGFQRRPTSTLHGPAMSRPLLEHVVRRHVEALSGVRIEDQTAVAGLTTDDAGAVVTGVRLTGREVAAADLVVDASGRQARSLSWLAELGYEPPPMSVVGVDTRYVTRCYSRSDRPVRDWKAAAVIGDPATKRLAMALPIEDDRWLVTFQGVNGVTAPTDDAALPAYARSLESPLIAELIEQSRPMSEPVTYRFATNQRRRLERMRRFPLGWVLLGDAVCSFDPIYGQGMTSAAQQAEALGRCLARAAAIDRSFARGYFRSVARVVAAPWSIAVGGDFVYDGTTGRKPFGTDLMNRYFDRATIAGQYDDRVVRRMNEVISLVRRPEALLTPAFVVRVLIRSRRRRSAGLVPEHGVGMADLGEGGAPTGSSLSSPNRS